MYFWMCPDYPLDIFKGLKARDQKGCLIFKAVKIQWVFNN